MSFPSEISYGLTLAACVLLRIYLSKHETLTKKEGDDDSNSHGNVMDNNVAQLIL